MTIKEKIGRGLVGILLATGLTGVVAGTSSCTTAGEAFGRNVAGSLVMGAAGAAVDEGVRTSIGGPRGTTVNVYNTAGRNYAAVNKIWVEHNIFEGSEKGMNIHSNMKVVNLQGVPIEVNAYFYHKNGVPLKDIDGEYGSDVNTVCSGTNICPDFQSANYKDWTIFIPYNQITESLPSGRTDILMNVELFAKLNGGIVPVGKSRNVSLWVSR
jgi:hypothetical protein